MISYANTQVFLRIRLLWHNHVLSPKNCIKNDCGIAEWITMLI
jgi:hypothetical protein